MTSGARTCSPGWRVRPLRTQGHDIPVTAWERLSREAGVVSGRAHWDQLLETLAVDLDGQATRPKQIPMHRPGGPRSIDATPSGREVSASSSWRLSTT